MHNSHLVHGFLYELREAKQHSCEEVLSVAGSSAYISQHLHTAGNAIDEYTQEQSQFQYNQRNIARQKQAQLNFLNKLSQDAEIKQLQSQHQHTAQPSPPSAASAAAGSGAGPTPAPPAHVDLTKDIAALIGFINQNANNHPVTMAAVSAYSPIQHTSAVEQILKNPVFRGVGRQNRLNNYLLCNQMDAYVTNIKGQAVQSLMKYYLIEGLHREGKSGADDASGKENRK